MSNQLSEFMKQYKEKTFLSSTQISPDEMMLFRVNPDGQVVSYLSDENISQRAEKRNDKAIEVPKVSVGALLGCYYYDEELGCGNGNECDGCALHDVVAQSLKRKKPVIKKVIKKQISFKKTECMRHYRVTTLYPEWFNGDMLLLIDDISNDYQTLELGRIEKYIREHIEMLTFDDIVHYSMAHAFKVLSSAFVVLYLFETEDYFNKKVYTSKSIENFIRGNDHDELVDRRLWLQCVNTKEVVVDNAYQMRIQKGMSTDTRLDIHRLLLCPVVNIDELMGVLILGNKPMAYNNTDVQLVKSFVDSMVNVIHYKRDIEKIRNEQQMQKNLAESVEFGMFRFISTDTNTMQLDYMNDSGFKLLSIAGKEVYGKSDIFISKMDNKYVKNYVAAREAAVSRKMPLEWSGPFYLGGRKRWLKISMAPAHVDDRGLCWEGSFADVTATAMKCHVVNQIHNQMVTMIEKDTYTRESLLALLDDLKTTVNQ